MVAWTMKLLSVYDLDAEHSRSLEAAFPHLEVTFPSKSSEEFRDGMADYQYLFAQQEGPILVKRCSYY
jgi:hypothetical protein